MGYPVPLPGIECSEWTEDRPPARTAGAGGLHHWALRPGHGSYEAVGHHLLGLREAAKPGCAGDSPGLGLVVNTRFQQDRAGEGCSTKPETAPKQNCDMRWEQVQQDTEARTTNRAESGWRACGWGEVVQVYWEGKGGWDAAIEDYDVSQGK